MTSDQLTLFAEDFPAPIFPLQAKVSASPGRKADYGASTPELLGKFDPATSSWKTWQLCFIEGLETFSETWPRSGTMRNGTAYLLPPLAPLTGGTGSGSWPTPTTRDHKDGAATPWLLEHTKSLLGRAVHLWPTPQANDNRDRGNFSSGAVMRRQEKGKQLYLSQTVSESTGALNPTWVEWLMGFPLGWTDLDR